MKFIPIEIPISELIIKNPFNGIFTDNYLEKHISAEQIATASIDIENRLNVKLKTGSYSSVLINQIAYHSLGGYAKFGNEIHQYHFPSILDTIECLDNNQTPSKVVNFKHKPLLGLKHAHHNSNTFLIQNMLNYWKSIVKNRNEIDFQNKILKDIYDDLNKSSTCEDCSDKYLEVLIQRILYKAKSRRPRKHTGEWVIFGEIKDVKYYLCLGTHNESDQDIYDRLKICYEEFPILKQLFDY